jgi:hypothetical protein
MKKATRIEGNPFVRYFLLQTGSEQIPVGAHAQEDRSTEEVDWHLSMLRLESRGKWKNLV